MSTGVDDHLDLGVVEGGAVDVRGVRPEQPGRPHLLNLGVLAVGADSDMGGDPSTGLPCQLPMIPGHFEVGELGAWRRQGQGQHLVLRGEMLGGGTHEPARLTLLPLPPPREPIGKHSPQTRVLEGLDHRIGVSR